MIALPLLPEKHVGDEFTLDDYRVVRDAVNSISSIVGSYPVLVSRFNNTLTIGVAEDTGAALFPFYARLTATAALSGSDSIFVYTFAEVTLTITASSGTPTGISYATLTGGRTGKAMNLAEWANGSSSGYAFGIYRAGTDYPAGFAPRPITGGGTDNTHQTNQIVQIVGSVVASDDTIIYVFERQGMHDGTCT